MMTRLRTLALSFAAAATLAFCTAAAHAQTPAAAPDSMTRQAADTPTTTHNWTTDQIVTATVHQAWLLADKDESNFFEIVKELAAISAKNRNLVLPDSAAAGQRAGAYIKKQAKADHDALLYAIVDKSVRMTGTTAPATGN